MPATLFFILGCLLVILCRGADDIPLGWIDAETGHKVIRLSREAGTASLYFHQNGYSRDGRRVVVTTPKGISTISLKSRETEQIVAGGVNPLVVGRRTGQLYYTRDGTVFTVDLDTRESREVAKIPFNSGRSTGNITVNADETLLVGITVDPDGKAEPRDLPPNVRAEGLAVRWAAGTPLILYTIDIKSGQLKRLHASNDWLNHLQCSPADPQQFMFCHEGPWHYVDRIWLTRANGNPPLNVHPRTMDMEIAGHEFFSWDGKAVWYDLQTPRSGVFWLAGYDIETGNRTWYQLQRNEWSVHYNISPDGTLFAGDGGGPTSVANRDHNGKALNPQGNGQWIYLFRPESMRMTGLEDKSKRLVKTGVLKSERLVNLARHNYTLEPNVTFTPDGKWVVFRSNMHGATHTYAVEVEKPSLKN